MNVCSLFYMTTLCADNVAESGVERTTRYTKNDLWNGRPYSLEAALQEVQALVFLVFLQQKSENVHRGPKPSQILAFVSWWPPFFPIIIVFALQSNTVVFC